VDELTDLVRHATTLAPPDLVKLATALFVSAKEHWSVESTVLGRITDERVYERPEHGGFVSGELWAKERLSMPGAQYRTSLRLWRLLSKAPDVNWREVKKPRALLLCDVADAGGNVAAWLKESLTAASTDAFKKKVVTFLALEDFATLRIRYPASLTEMVNEAFERGLYAHAGSEGVDGTEVRDWRQPAFAHLALEAVLLVALEHLPAVPSLAPRALPVTS
jgi:hypothetical protein